MSGINVRIIEPIYFVRFSSINSDKLMISIPNIPRLRLAVAVFVFGLFQGAAAACDAVAYATCTATLTIPSITSTNTTEVCNYVSSFYDCYGAADCCSIADAAAATWASYNCTVSCTPPGSTSSSSSLLAFAFFLKSLIVLRMMV